MKRLRKIARELNLDPKNSYAPVGPEVHVEARNDHGRQYSAGIKRRPLALKACERRAYLEAKAIYKGGVVEAGVAAQVLPERKPFHIRHVDSMKYQPYNPTNGGTSA